MRSLRTTALGGVAAVATLAALASPVMTTAAHAGSVQLGGHTIQTADAEKHVVVPGDGAVSASDDCAHGYVPTGGGVLVDDVDNGDSSAVHVLSSRPTWSPKAGWTVQLRNDNDGRAQGKVKVACTRLVTTVAGKDKHTHQLQDTKPSTITTGKIFDGVVTHSAACPAGTVPIRPGYTSTSAVRVTGTTVSTTGYSFTFEALEGTDGPVSGLAKVPDVAISLDCLPTSLSTAGTPAHGHDITVTTATASYDARGATSEGVVTCPSGSVSLLGAYSSTEPGLSFLGSDPRGTQRMFRFLNDFDEASKVDLTITCLAAAPELQRAITIDKLGSISGRTIPVQVGCSFTCTVTVKLSPKGSSKVYATGKATFIGSKTVKLAIKNDKHLAALEKLTHVTLTATAGSTKAKVDVKR